MRYVQRRMTHPPSLRSYERADLKAMVALDAICFAPQFLFPRSAMRRFAEAQGAEPIVAIGADGLLAGFVIADIEHLDLRSRGYVITLDVAPAYRRSGLASRLMQAVEGRAAAKRLPSMALHVHAENEGAIRFYERRGYMRIGTEPDFYGKGLDGLVYLKDLQPPG